MLHPGDGKRDREREEPLSLRPSLSFCVPFLSLSVPLRAPSGDNRLSLSPRSASISVSLFSLSLSVCSYDGTVSLRFYLLLICWPTGPSAASRRVSSRLPLSLSLYLSLSLPVSVSLSLSVLSRHLRDTCILKSPLPQDLARASPTQLAS